MKKLILVSVILLMAGVTIGQTLKKGMVVAVSSYELILNDNVTFDQFLAFYQQKDIPELEKLMPGLKIIVLTGDRGENKFRFGNMYVFDDVATRDKYYPKENDTTTSAPLLAIESKLRPLDQEFNKYIKSMTRVYTDWIIGETSGAELKKGTVVAVSAYDFVLKDNVTSKQFNDFNEQKYNPAIENAMPGTKLIVLSGDRGQNKFHPGEMWIFDNIDVRNKYFPDEASTTDSPVMKTVLEKVKPLSDEGSNFVLDTKRVYTDWIVR